MSAHHSRLGASALKSRSTRSGAQRTPATRTVVRVFRGTGMPSSPAAAISRSTRFLPTRMPYWSRSSAWTRGEP